MVPHIAPAILRSPAMLVRLMVNGVSTVSGMFEARRLSRIWRSRNSVSAVRILSAAAVEVGLELST